MVCDVHVVEGLACLLPALTHIVRDWGEIWKDVLQQQELSSHREQSLGLAGLCKNLRDKSGTRCPATRTSVKQVTNLTTEA